MVPCRAMSKDRVVEMNPGASQGTRDRDLVIRCVKDELLAFMARKFLTERGRPLKHLGPEVACMVEGLAEGMAILHVDAIRSAANGDMGAYERKLAIARATEAKK